MPNGDLPAAKKGNDSMAICRSVIATLFPMFQRSNCNFMNEHVHNTKSASDESAMLVLIHSFEYTV